jgi:hypothetical protein
MSYSSKDLENMCKIIETFSKEENIKILEIIKLNDNTSLSENNNGTFIHMEDLSINTLNQIKTYMDYVLKKEGEINMVEQTKDKMKNNINNKCKDE